MPNIDDDGMVAVDAKLGKWKAAHALMARAQRMLESGIKRADSPQEIAFLRTTAKASRAASDQALAEVEQAIAAHKSEPPPSSFAPL